MKPITTKMKSTLNLCAAMVLKSLRIVKTVDFTNPDLGDSRGRMKRGMLAVTRSRDAKNCLQKMLLRKIVNPLKRRTKQAEMDEASLAGGAVLAW
jgi:hypothetical protein